MRVRSKRRKDYMCKVFWNTFSGGCGHMEPSFERQGHVSQKSCASSFIHFLKSSFSSGESSLKLLYFGSGVCILGRLNQSG